MWRLPGDVDWDDTIEVPFSPETSASGVENTGFYRACWYRRRVETPVLRPGQRLVLHFGAVDYLAKVWVNGTALGEHIGGYTPFSFDITQQALDAGECEVIVSRRGRSARPREAERQAGLAARAALDLVPADDRYLADRMDGGGAGDRSEPCHLHSASRALGDRRRVPGSMVYRTSACGCR